MFKKGDKVICMDNARGAEYALQVGKIYTIKEIHPVFTDEAHLEESDTGSWAITRFKLATNDRKFKVGDIVCRVWDRSISAPIIRVDNSSDPYWVVWPSTSVIGRTGLELNYGASDLELVTPGIGNPANQCKHHRKNKVEMVFTAFMYCPDCKQDLGDIKDGKFIPKQGVQQ